MRFSQTNPLTATGCVEIFNTGSPIDLCNLVQVFFAGRAERQPNELRITLVRDMNKRRGICTAHIQRVIRPLGFDHPEIRQEFFRFIEIRRLKPSEGNIFNFYHFLSLWPFWAQDHSMTTISSSPPM